MAKGMRARALERSPSAIAGGIWPGVTVEVEQGLGVGKLRILGADCDRTFKRLTGAQPPKPRNYKEAGRLTFAWLAPGEWLVTGEEALVSPIMDRLNADGGDSVLAVDLTHGRTAFLLSGANARAALNTHSPLDLRAESFPVGATARSLLGDTRMFIARLPDVPGGPSFQVIVDQTMGPYAARLLTAAAKSGVGN